ncbi:hypothetical protein CW304_12345 [Bacillus sp. UFRGS-B20]|nr:hypothetical protein CW304_12345 [Bacillus sp. UFRGS-B20]
MEVPYGLEGLFGDLKNTYPPHSSPTPGYKQSHCLLILNVASILIIVINHLRQRIHNIATTHVSIDPSAAVGLP